MSSKPKRVQIKTKSGEIVGELKESRDGGMYEGNGWSCGCEWLEGFAKSLGLTVEPIELLAPQIYEAVCVNGVIEQKGITIIDGRRYRVTIEELDE